MTSFGVPVISAAFGVRIIESEFLMEDGEPYDRERTWKERLLSWPWRPLTRTERVTPKVPFKGAIKLDAGMLVMHPATLRRLKETIIEKEKA